MDHLRASLNKKISLKSSEIKNLSGKIKELESQKMAIEGEVRGMKEALNLIPKEATASSFEKDVSSMRKNSVVAEAYRAIFEKRKPMHVDDILKKIGKSDEDKNKEKDNKQALAGQLGYNVRENRIFERTSPNTFGLLFWNFPIPDGILTKDIAEPEPEDISDDDEHYDLPDNFDDENSNDEW